MPCNCLDLGFELQHILDCPEDCSTPQIIREKLKAKDKLYLYDEWLNTIKERERILQELEELHLYEEIKKEYEKRKANQMKGVDKNEITENGNDTMGIGIEDGGVEHE